RFHSPRPGHFITVPFHVFGPSAKIRAAAGGVAISAFEREGDAAAAWEGILADTRATPGQRHDFPDSGKLPSCTFESENPGRNGDARSAGHVRHVFVLHG